MAVRDAGDPENMRAPYQQKKTYAMDQDKEGEMKPTPYPKKKGQEQSTLTTGTMERDLEALGLSNSGENSPCTSEETYLKLKELVQ